LPCRSAYIVSTKSSHTQITESVTYFARIFVWENGTKVGPLL
jgi:hypothetical protein